MARHRCGQEGRGRCGGFGRQYRRPDGDGQIPPARPWRDRSSGDCGALADAEGIVDRARPGASIGADAPHLVDLAAMGGAMAQVLFGLERPTVGLLNIGVEEAEGAGRGARGRPNSAGGQWPQFRVYRLRGGRRYRQGDRGRGGDRRICGEYCAQGRRGDGAPDGSVSQDRTEPDDLDAARLSVRAQCVQGARQQDGPAQVERRGLPRPQRHRHQEPRRHRCRRFRLRDPCRTRSGAP